MRIGVAGTCAAGVLLLAAAGAAEEIPAAAPIDQTAADLPPEELLAAARRDFEYALGDLESGLAADARRARDLLEPAVAVFRRARASGAEAEALHALGLAQAQIGEAERALELYRRALELQRELGNRQGEAAALNNIGLVLAETGRPIEALAELEAAFPLRRAAGDPRGEAATAHNLAALHVQLGEIQPGLDYYYRALELHRQLDDPGAEAATLNNLGLVLARLGELEKADAHLRRALALHRAGGNLRGEAGTLANLGLASFELDRRAVALSHLAAARDLYRAIGDRAGEGDVLNNLGLVHLEARRPEPAGKNLEQALEIQRLLGDRRGEAAVLSNLGQLYRQRRQFEPARRDLEHALDLQRRVKDPWGASSTLLELARLAADRDRLEQALATIEQAINLVESLRADLLSPDYRASLIGGRREIYEFHVDVLMRLDRERPGSGHGESALVAAEAARARGLLTSLGEARAGIRHGTGSELTAARRALRRRLSARESVRRRLLEQGDHRRAGAIDEEIEALLESYRRLDEEIRRRDPRYGDLVRPEPPSADAVRRLLDDATVLLEYSLGEERSALWIVTSGAITGHVLAGRERIEEAARRLHERLARSRQRTFRGAARIAAAELAELILEPAREALGRRRIAVIADGALEYVPFGILPLGGAAGRPLGLDHELVSLPSVSVLASIRHGEIGRGEKGRDTSPLKMLAILADPVFGAGDPRLGEPRPGEPRLGEPRPGAITGDAEALPRLVHSRREAAAVAALVPAGQRLLALDFAARRELLTEGVLEPYRMVHIATHGILDTRRPELSALVLSQFDVAGRVRDGHLRLLDIYNLELRADLVVLSACRTALGREIRGEGLISLARGFFYAGARQVLVSLWNVDDEATAVLMERFYRGLLVEGLPAAAALGAAQAQVASERRWQAPYYWAGFVLQGDWR